MFIAEKQKRSNNLVFLIKELVMSVFLILARNPGATATSAKTTLSFFTKQAQDEQLTAYADKKTIRTDNLQ